MLDMLDLDLPLENLEEGKVVRVPDGPLGLLVRTVQIVQSDYFDRTV